MIAITRDVSPSIAECELTHVERTPIDWQRAVEQHEAYRELLASLGCEVVRLPADPAYPDCVFVEDTAIVLDGIAVITNPGAASRRGETEAVAAALAPYLPLARMPLGGGATLDGGDVLVADRTIYAGRSLRTNDAGIALLRELAAPHGYSVAAVDVTGCLHLKSAITRVSDTAMLVNRAWIDVAPFDGWQMIDVDPSEPFGGNALKVGAAVIHPSAWTRTRARLESAGIEVVPVEADELAKAEGGVTCCSLLIA
ncbi:MAG TPA: arginine deiminase-related protein [Vicinamibacterales bacterium]